MGTLIEFTPPKKPAPVDNNSGSLLDTYEYKFISETVMKHFEALVKQIISDKNLIVQNDLNLNRRFLTIGKILYFLKISLVTQYKIQGSEQRTEFNGELGKAVEDFIDEVYDVYCQRLILAKQAAEDREK